MKKALFAILIVFSIFSSCNKDVQKPESKFVETPYHLFDQAAATAKVESFITALSPDWREDFEDTEINEGKWLLEATGNYLKNVNSTGVVKEVDSIEVSIDLVDDNGIQKMTGSSMIAKYNDVLNQVTAREDNDEVIATGMDVKIDAVTSDNANLKFYVTYRGIGGVVDYWTFPEARTRIGEILTDKVAAHRNSCVHVWTPERYGFFYSPYKYTLGSRETNFVLSSIPNAWEVYYYGEETWAQEDADLLFDIGVDCANNPDHYIPIPQGNSGPVEEPQMAPGAIDEIVFDYMRYYNHFPPVPDEETYKYRFVEQVTYLSGISWCY